MKTIRNIIMTALALAVGYAGVSAQSKLSTETSIVTNKNGTGLPFHRTVVETKPVTFKYDKTTPLGSAADPIDVGAVFLNDLFSNDNTKIGAYAINVGNFDIKDEQFFGTWIRKNYGDITATLEAGKGSRESGPSREFAILYFKSPKFSGDAGYFAQGSTFTGNDIWKYFWGAYHDEHSYIGAGQNKNVDWGFLGVKGFEDFGSFTFAKYDPATGDVWIKNQTAAGNVSKSFYNTGMFNTAANYFTLPAFFTKKFSPVSTKGDIAMKFEYKKCPPAGTKELEVMLGTNQTPIQLGVGINTGYKNNTSTSGLAVELFKEFSIAGIKGDVEIRYNGRTKDLQTYVKAGYEF